MAIDAYMYFKDYSNKYMASESQVNLIKSGDPDAIFNLFSGPASGSNVTTVAGVTNNGLFEVEDYSFDIEQTLNIGSGGSGSGAGKITFNPFSITRKIDCSSPVFFQMACAGTPFREVSLGLRKSSGGSTAAIAGGSGAFFVSFTFKLVAVKTISWAHDDESPKETVTFEYGAMVIQYAQQKTDGTFTAIIPGGWNKVNNIGDNNPTLALGGSGST